jgi:hypothetical protein
MKTPLLAASLFLALPAFGQAPPELTPQAKAQCQVDLQELGKMASRNAWPGVNTKYEALTAAGCSLTPGDHQAGAQASETAGNVREWLKRVNAAKKACDGMPSGHACKEEAAQDEYNGAVRNILCFFAVPNEKAEPKGWVVTAERRAALDAERRKLEKEAKKTGAAVPEEKPLLKFNGQIEIRVDKAARASLIFAEKTLRATNVFTGFVPLGEYEVDGVVSQVVRPDKEYLISKYSVVCPTE